jgi:trimethylamine--corrinoid protein Co-methyltransferase
MYFFPQTRGPLCMKQPDETLGRRSRRRPSSADVSHAVFDRTRSYRHLRNPFVPLKVFSDDQVAAVHDAALVMLEMQGMKVLSGHEGTIRRCACQVSKRRRRSR